MSEIRVDRFKAEDGISAPQFPNGLQVTGVVTATVLDTSVPFLNVGSNAKLGATGVVTATSFTGGSFSGTTISGTTGSFSGNVSIGGTLTYEDVTSIDSIGIVTARSGVVSPYADIDDFVSVGSNIHLGNAGIASVSGLKVTGASNFNSTITGTATTAILANTATTLTVVNDGSDAETFVTFTPSATGNQNFKTNTGLKFNASNGTLTATSFAGNGANLTGVVAVPTGAIMAWPVESAPSGFILCHGQAISRSTYSDLFSLIGVMYGAGDGSANFNLPDYRGQFLRGRANGSTNDPDRDGRTDRGDGNGGDNVGTKQDYGLLQHSHGNNSNGTNNHGFNTNNNNTGAFSKSGHSYGGTRASSHEIITNSWGTNHANVSGHVTNNEIRPINIYVNWIIKS